MRVFATGQSLARSAAAIAVALVLTGCDIAVDGHGGFDLDLASSQTSDEWTRSYPLGAGGRLEIINVNGRITAEPTDGTSVEVRAQRTAKAGSDDAARDLLARLEMREEVGEARVRVEVRAPRQIGRSSHEVKWTIKVPRGVAVDLRTVNGGVHLTGLDGEVRARSTNGGIVGTALAATSLDAAVTNGGVEIALVRPVEAGSFTLEAVNGGVSLDLPAASRAHITGRCVNGGITTSGLALDVSGEQSRRRLEATLNGGGARVSLSTVNGGVRLGDVPAPAGR